MITLLSSLQDNLAFIIFAQGLGLVGVLVDFYAANQKCDKRLIKLTALNSIIFTVHFSLIMAFAAAISDLITGIRYWLAGKHAKAWIGVFFICLYLLMAVFLAKKLLDVLPFVGSVMGTFGIYFLKGISMRFFFILGQILWVIYSAIIFSLGGFLTYSMLIIMTSRTIYRLHQEKQ